MNSSVFIIVDFVFRIASLLFLARFLLQASSADFYNPVSQGIVKATDPILKPLRSIVRPYKQFDFASLLVAWLIGIAFIWILAAIQGGGIAIPTLLIGGLVRTVLVLIQFYWWTIIIVIIASFVAQGTYHPALGLLSQLAEPILGPLRRIIPPLGPLDLSPMVAIVALTVLQNQIGIWYYG